MRLSAFLAILLLAFVSFSSAQDAPGSGMPEMSHMYTGPAMAPFIETIERHQLSGTDVEPQSSPNAMLMFEHGPWRFMLHGRAFLNEMQQTGPRGGDKLFSTNWLMGMAQRKLGRDVLTIRSMFSLEPATVSIRRYPELFQQGETAYGNPISDGQHPHDFVMELAALYDVNLSDRAAISFYAAPVGDPALGPTAYPHRSSASEDPIAPLGHHLEDSTHIADEVVTVGLAYAKFRVEGSAFHGREPDEYRWDIDSGKIDSWSARATFNPAADWSFQYSIAHLTSPEALAASEDIRRMTASLAYNRPLHRGNCASLVLWGRNQSLREGNIGNAYIFESTLRFLDRNSVWTRLENVDRTNELLLDNGRIPPGFTERYFARVQAYTAGLDREFGNLRHLSTAIGAQATWFGVPNQLKANYGAHPFGAVVFLKVAAR